MNDIPTTDKPMTAKEYLSQAYHLDQRINAKLEQVLSLRELAAKATNTLSDMPGADTPNVCRMEDVILKILLAENELNAEIDRLVDLKREIREVIGSVDQLEYQTMLELRYLCFKRWEEIAVDMHLDLRWVHRLHTKALNAVDEIRH